MVRTCFPGNHKRAATTLEALALVKFRIGLDDMDLTMPLTPLSLLSRLASHHSCHVLPYRVTAFRHRVWFLLSGTEPRLPEAKRTMSSLRPLIFFLSMKYPPIPEPQKHFMNNPPLPIHPSYHSAVLWRCCSMYSACSLVRGHGCGQRRGPMLKPLLAEAEASQGEEAPQQVHAKRWQKNVLF